MRYEIHKGRHTCGKCVVYAVLDTALDTVIAEFETVKEAKAFVADRTERDTITA